MDISDRVESIGKNMSAILIKGLRSGKIVLERAQEIAGFYLDKVENVTNEEELNKDIQEMEATMPEMKTVVEFAKAQEKELHEQVLKQRIEELMKAGKIEEAAELAKNKTL